jgi:hypothetical protein
VNDLALSDTEIRAVVAEDRLAGEVVLLCASGARPNPHDLRRVEAALSGYSIPHRWAEAEALAATDV